MYEKRGVWSGCFFKQLIISGVNPLFDKLRLSGVIVKDKVQEVCF